VVPENVIRSNVAEDRPGSPEGKPPQPRSRIVKLVDPPSVKELGVDGLPRPNCTTAGWVTFGQVLPPGAAPGGLQLGDFETQTDVKTRWRDGSIRFAVVTARVTRPGAQKVKAAPPRGGSFIPTVPEAIVRLRIGNDFWTAALAPNPSTDAWLAGPLVQEWRTIVAPVNALNRAHPFVRVLFDTRVYKDGQARLDVTVENTLNQQAATRVTYDVEVTAGGKSRWRGEGLTHWYLTRWRKVFLLGPGVSAATPDFEPAFQARALPRYLSLASRERISIPPGPKFAPLQCGYLEPDMRSHGGRPELAPYPDWTAQYLVGKDPNLLRYVLAYGDLAGSWPVHVREAEKGEWPGLGPGRLVSIDERPDFWFDGSGRADKGNAVEGDLAALGPLAPDNNHVPSLAYVPYLVTGDRYYADEMAFWANYALLSTFQDRFNNARGGSKGLLMANEPRGVAWALRNLADAATYLPDRDPVRPYLAEKVMNNLKWMDEYAQTHVTPLGTFFEGRNPDEVTAELVWIPRPWQNNYIAWSVDHAIRHGFSGGQKLRAKLATFQLRLFTSRDYPREYAAPYALVVGKKLPNGETQYFTSLKEVFQATFGNPPDKPAPFPGYYGVDARLALMIACEQGMEGAQAAYTYLHPKIAVQIKQDGLPDLALRPGWALTTDPSPTGF
jgi:hypothetical protein